MQEGALEMDNLAGTMFGSMITGMAGGWPAAVAFMAFNLLSVPCMAAVAAAAGEFQSRKKLWFAIGYWMGTAYVVSAAVFWFLFAIYKGFWWIDLIVVAVIAVVITAIVLIKKYATKRG
jgi:ferrous iron transport protein B